MLVLHLIFRVLHIFGGMFWVGAAIIYSLFLIPAAHLSAPESGKYMQALMVRRRFPMTIGIASWITILSGVIMYWFGSGGLSLQWITSGVGLGYTLSAMAAFVSFVIGMAVLSPTAKKMGDIRASFGPQGPTPEQRGQLAVLEQRMSSADKVDVTFLVIALFGMAIARYLTF